MPGVQSLASSPHRTDNTSADIRVATSDRRVAAWLFVCCALVFAMVVVGGVTRLTHSGLSIVEWQQLGICKSVRKSDDVSRRWRSLDWIGKQQWESNYISR